MITQQRPLAAYRIPFNKPTRTPDDLPYIHDVMESGKLSGDGPYTRKAQALLEELLGVPKALLTSSCTDALEITGLLAGIKPGDEVIVPTFTFVSSINAYVLRGATPVFADMRADTLSLDERQLDDLVTPRTRAIVAVHYAGVGCDMDRINAAAARVGAVVIEDNAHGFLGRFRGKLLGTFGAMATLSFHDSKNFTCGEGGALLVNDHALIERSEVIREKGTDRKKFLRGQIDKYGWVDLGSSYLPSEIQAAMLLAQLESHVEIQARREQHWKRYAAELSDWAAQHGVRMPGAPADREISYHMFNMLAPSIPFRDALFAFLKARGMQAVSHYIPLHLSPMGRQFGGRDGQCPVAEEVNELIVRLPFYTNMTEDEQRDVIEAVRLFPGA